MTRRNLSILLIISALLIGLFYVSKNKNSNNYADLIPKGAFLRETDFLSDTPKRDLIVYIEKPKFGEEAQVVNDSYTCPGSTEGLAIEGIYHLALTDGKKILNEVILPNDSIKKNNPQVQNLAYKNTMANAYRYFSGNKFTDQNRDTIVPVKLIEFGNYTEDANNKDFSITGATIACGHTTYLHGGYSKSLDKIVLYPIKSGDSLHYWGDNFNPDKDGYANENWQCGDHASTTSDLTAYKYESTASAYIAYKHTVTDCSKSQ